MYIKNQYDKINIDNKDIVLDGNESIVKDINKVIDHIQNHKILATKAKRHFAIKNIKEINDILLKPIEIISTRPSQKTYPNVNGVYLLLRTMGIVRFKVSKKEIVMEINKELLKNWQKLNRTEQYFMLLEFWLIHSHPEDTIEAFNRSPLMEINNFFLKKSELSLKKTIELLNYSPQYYNLALYEMFGFVEIETKKPTEKNTWNIIEIKVRPLIKKILPLTILNKSQTITLILDPPKLGFFQHIFQPHFKEFRNILKYPKEPVVNGVYRLKVSLGRVYRMIDIDSKESLDTLAVGILEQFDFDCDHLYEFNFTDHFGKEIRVSHSALSDAELWTDKYYLKNLPLKERESFKFIFDFGDSWEFDILIETIDESRKIDDIELIKSYGEAPEQYPDYDEW